MGQTKEKYKHRYLRDNAQIENRDNGEEKKFRRNYRQGKTKTVLDEDINHEIFFACLSPTNYTRHF